MNGGRMGLFFVEVDCRREGLAEGGSAFFGIEGGDIAASSVACEAGGGRRARGSGFAYLLKSRTVVRGWRGFGVVKSGQAVWRKRPHGGCAEAAARWVCGDVGAATWILRKRPAAVARRR